MKHILLFLPPHQCSSHLTISLDLESTTALSIRSEVFEPNGYADRRRNRHEVDDRARALPMGVSPKGLFLEGELQNFESLDAWLHLCEAKCHDT